MSNLFVLKCADEATGENILDTLKRLNKQHLITVEDAALVTLKPNGKPKIRQDNDLVGIRILALIVGLFGVIIAFIINILYSSLHVLGRVAGITTDRSHFFWGLLVVLIGLVGSLVVPFVPIAGAVLLLVAGIAFFFIAGWWALLASPFLLIAAALAYNHSRAQQPRVG